jgi:hypothetical protein
MHANMAVRIPMDTLTFMMAQMMLHAKQITDHIIASAYSTMSMSPSLECMMVGVVGGVVTIGSIGGDDIQPVGSVLSITIVNCGGTFHEYAGNAHTVSIIVWTNVE